MITHKRRRFPPFKLWQPRNQNRCIFTKWQRDQTLMNMIIYAVYTTSLSEKRTSIYSKLLGHIQSPNDHGIINDCINLVSFILKVLDEIS
ncbi:hypothetical protein HanRHA438_Chr09g0374941 [Helianthus annuus]|nr:hypothetical protein HanRHA438_Chr09g0374941 [Helianthus annuus]